MTTAQRKALLRAGEKIAMYKFGNICKFLPIGICLSTIEEAELISPYDGWTSDLFLWWDYNDYESRLIGIAFMLTMPPEILQGKCSKNKTKNK